jgi:hypothetical protein
MQDQSLPPAIATRRPAFCMAFHSRKVPGSASSVRSIERKSSLPRAASTTTSHGTQQPPGGTGNEPSLGQNWPWAIPTTARGCCLAQSTTGTPDCGIPNTSDENASESSPSRIRCPVPAAAKWETSRS